MLIMRRRHIVVREETYNKLLGLKAKTNAKSIDKVIELLIERYENTDDIQSLGKMIIDMLKPFVDPKNNVEILQKKEGGTQ